MYTEWNFTSVTGVVNILVVVPSFKIPPVLLLPSLGKFAAATNWYTQSFLLCVLTLVLAIWSRGLLVGGITNFHLVGHLQLLLLLLVGILLISWSQA